VSGADRFFSWRSRTLLSLIYSLLDYEKSLRNDAVSPTESDRASSIAEEEAEWSRRRQALDSQADEEDNTYSVVRREAEALDQAMIDRLETRRGSVSSTASSSSMASPVVPLLGAVPPFKRRYTRNRQNSKASMSSMRSFNSAISEDLVEEEEEAEVLGLGSAYDTGSRSPSVDESPVDSPQNVEFTPRTARPGRTAFAPLSAAPTKLSFGLLTAPAHKTEFGLASPLRTAIRPSFDMDSTPKPKSRRRPAPLVDILPPVPSSPDALPLAAEVAQPEPAPAPVPKHVAAPLTLAVPPPRRTRTKSGQPTPPPLFLRTLSNNPRAAPLPSSGPSQTLFVFPPSPKNVPAPSRTPSTMTLMSNLQQVPFPMVSPPRVSTEEKHGRRRSYVALGVPMTPTTACSRVDARGWFGQDS
jgi:tyrosine-protein phosphatase